MQRLEVKETVHDVAFSPDGLLLATADHAGRIGLWSVADGKRTRTLESHEGDVYAVAFSPRGDLLASGGDDGVLRLWSVTGGSTSKRETLPRAMPVSTLAFSGGGSHVVVMTLGSVVLSVPVGHGDAMAFALGAGYRSTIRHVVVSPEGDLLAAVWRFEQGLVSRSQLRVCNVSSGRMVARFDAGERVTFTPQGDLISQQENEPPTLHPLRLRRRLGLDRP